MLIRRSFHNSSILCNRIPLIKFIGKRSKNKVNNTVLSTTQSSSNNTIRSSVSSTSSSSSSSSSLSSSTTKQSTTNMSFKGTSIPGSGVDFRTLKGGAMYGRPSISLKEMEEVESGGANSF
jgi:hypothetical protein